MIIRDALDKIYPNEPLLRMDKPGRSIQQAQETIYLFLLGVVKKWPPEEVLLEFKRLFIYHVDSISTESMQALDEIVFSNNEEEFRNTLKRCCYILVNNWDATRNYQPIHDLIKTFTDVSISRKTASPTLKRLRQWVENFVGSHDFEELNLFASRYEDHDRGPWAARYTSYLLVPQYIDLRNPIEQREAARTLSKQLKDRFKFDLAMYIARSQTKMPVERIPKNPTVLGDEVLRLIKAIVAKRGPFSYASVANIFTNQIKHLTYKEFKQSLKQYLVFAIDNQDFVEALQAKLTERLDVLYENHDEEIISNALILRTCNRLIEYLTTENQEDPSQLFILLLSQGNPVTLVIVLLKIILICKHARTHLEACIAELVKYYQNYPEDECAWVVNFLEVFNVTFTIHTENVQYNLIKMEVDEPAQSALIFDPDKYRIFSQLKRESKLELLPEMIRPDSINPEIIDPEELLPESE
ncbi:MAG: hypothetical protein WCA35_15665 [Kovacikia sp.]